EHPAAFEQVYALFERTEVHTAAFLFIYHDQPKPTVSTQVGDEIGQPCRFDLGHKRRNGHAMPGEHLRYHIERAVMSAHHEHPSAHVVHFHDALPTGIVEVNHAVDVGIGHVGGAG